MRAAELMVTDYPTVTPATSAWQAARQLAGADLPGLVVVDKHNRPRAVLPGYQVLGLAVPIYCQDDPALASVIDEAAADVFARELADRTVKDCLRPQGHELPVVDPDATLLEIAALMARTHSPLVAVAGADERLAGVITLHALLDQALGAGAEEGAGDTA